MASEEDTMSTTKRLGLAGTITAVLALLVGGISPALGSSRQGAAST
jgi:hypothetical protein